MTILKKVIALMMFPQELIDQVKHPQHNEKEGQSGNGEPAFPYIDIHRKIRS